MAPFINRSSSDLKYPFIFALLIFSQINDKSAETLSLVDVRREIELSKEVMSLEITREPQDESDSIRNNGRFVPVLPVAGGYPNGEHITATTVSTVESALPRPPVVGNGEQSFLDWMRA